MKFLLLFSIFIFPVLGMSATADCKKNAYYGIFITTTYNMDLDGELYHNVLELNFKEKSGYKSFDMDFSEATVTLSATDGSIQYTLNNTHLDTNEYATSGKWYYPEPFLEKTYDITISKFKFGRYRCREANLSLDYYEKPFFVGDMEWRSGELFSDFASMSNLGQSDDLNLMGTTTNAVKTWKYGVVPYVFSSSMPVADQNSFRNAADQLAIETGIIFIEKNIWEPLIANQPQFNRVDGAMNKINYLFIHFDNRLNGGRSTVGHYYRTDCSPQTIVSGPWWNQSVVTLARCIYGGEMTLGQGLGQGIIIHEMLHTLGFLHEHLNPQANNMAINLGVVQSEFENNFQSIEQTFEGTTANAISATQYDSGSIMHYASWQFSICGAEGINDPKWQGVNNPQLLACRATVNPNNGVINVQPHTNPTDICAFPCATILNSGNFVVRQRTNLTNPDITGIHNLYPMQLQFRNQMRNSNNGNSNYRPTPQDLINYVNAGTFASKRQFSVDTHSPPASSDGTRNKGEQTSCLDAGSGNFWSEHYNTSILSSTGTKNNCYVYFENWAQGDPNFNRTRVCLRAEAWSEKKVWNPLPSGGGSGYTNCQITIDEYSTF